MEEALEGIKVADFSWVAAGPLATLYLAAHGATVIRVESLTHPDAIRTSSPFKDSIPGINRSGYFAFFNANKFSIALNMSHPKAIEVARKLIIWSDIVVENFTPGTMEKWGLGYEDLKKIKPSIVMLRTSNQGATGPHAQHPGFGHQLVALCGFSEYTGWPDRAPVALGMAYTDPITPRYSVAALIAALDYRDRTGKGQMLDISQMELGLQFLAPLALDYTVNGRVGGRIGNACSYAAPHGIYRCRGEERWCAIAIFSDEEWQRFCQVIGRPSFAGEPKFVTLLKRKKNEAELDQLVEDWTSHLAAEEVMNLLQTNGIPAGVVKNAEDIYNDPQLKQRGLSWVLEHKEIGPFQHLCVPFKLSKTPQYPRMPAPCLGEDTQYVCREMLDISEQEFDELLIEGVFE